MRRPTHYDMLEVVEHASPEVIRGAYKHLQQKWHPDRNPAAQAADMTRRINEAFETLSDPARREAYDAQLRSRRPASASAIRHASLTRREWFVGGLFFLSLASFATNSISFPAPVAPVPASAPADAIAEAVADAAPAEPRSELLDRILLNAEKAAAEEPVDDADAERARLDAEYRRTTAWWHDAALLAEGDFKLQYVGTIQGQPGVGLMFSTVPSLRSLNRNAIVLDADGAPAKGRWKLCKNPRLARFGSLAPGQYTVVLKPRLADVAGETLGLKLEGPVVVEDRRVLAGL